jgi:lipopolysaccharide/colanic/teichoic acid biosynthesis glycosyltransferase
MTKRLFDFVVAVAALGLTWPLILAAAVAVRLSSPGPAFYRSKRAGLEGRPFYLVKLRTMRTATVRPDERVTAPGDGRITSVGRWLRLLKLDELPQFWNVLKGEMSVVGPRPEDWDIVQRHYTAGYRRTLSIRPGITSPTQVRWYPDLTYHDPPPEGTSMQEHYLARHLPAKLGEEMRYVERQSLLLDVKVLLQTVYCAAVRSWLRPPEKQPLDMEAERYEW